VTTATVSSTRWILVAALAYAVCAQADYLFSLSPAEVSRRVYWGSFFPEMLEVGKYVRSRAREGDRIAVLGSEPEIYFYTGLHSATGYIYAYPLMEPQKYAHRMQEEMIHEIESARPEFLVLVVTQFTWFCNPDSDTTILRWADRYWRREYTQIGLANMGDPESVVYLWGDEAAYEDPTTDQYVRVLMRREHRGRGSGE
jgi:hypothetical protein